MTILRSYFIVLIFFFCSCMILPFWIKTSPLDTHLNSAFMPPSLMHYLGTDELGRDLFSRICFGARTTLLIGFFSVTLASFLGTFLGLIAGYWGGKVDLLICQCIDISLAFPSLLLAIGITVVLPPGFFSVVLALGLTGWASFTRLIRSETMVLKNMDYVLASKSLGGNSLYIVIRHVLPNCIYLLIVSISLQLGSFMLAESGLSFLGLGIPQPNPTLGGMIASGKDYLYTSPWIPLFPGILIALIVLFVNLIGDGIQKQLDPKRNKN